MVPMIHRSQELVTVPGAFVIIPNAVIRARRIVLHTKTDHDFTIRALELESQQIVIY